MSIEAQMDRAVQYKHYKLQDVQWSTECYPEGSPPGFFVDRGVSAYGNSRLNKRPAGSRLLNLLQKGDHVLVWSVDRMFRNLGDFGTVMAMFAKRGIIVHFIHEGIDLSTASGQLKAAICAVLAEHWSRMISFRTKEANAIKAARQGKAIAPKPKAPVDMRLDEVAEFRDCDQIAGLVAATPSRKKKKQAIKIGRTWGYVRVSSTGQVESGLGLQYQRERVEQDLASLGGECLGIVADEAVSSFKVPFAQRPGGMRILAEAQRGDCVVVYRFDRIFRSLQDMANTLKEFARRGIVLRLIEEGIQTDRNDGDWYLGLLGTFAELESTMKGERIAEAKAKLKREGRKYTRQLMCYKPMYIDGQDRFVLSGSKMIRFRMGHIVWKEMGFTKSDAAHVVNALMAQNRRKQWHNHVFEMGKEKRKHLLLPAQIARTHVIWPQMIDSVGITAINRFDKVARKELATDISEVTLLRLKRAGVPLERLADWFVVMGVDRRIPAALQLREGNNLLTAVENL